MAQIDKKLGLYKNAAGNPVDSISIRDTDNHDSDIVPFGMHDYGSALLTVYNSMDQSVAVTILGQNSGDENWQTAAASTTVGSGANGSLAVSAPWALLKVRCASAVAPSSGSVTVKLNRIHGVATAVSTSGALSTDVIDRAARDLGKVDIADIDGFASVAGQKAKAAAFPVTLASDEDLLDRIGEVQASPTENTVLDRLKDLLTGIILAAGSNAIGKLAANSGVDIGDVDVTSISAGETHVGEVGASGATKTGTLTVDTDAYTAGDCVGGLTALTNVARVSGGHVVLNAMTLWDEDGQDEAYRVYLFSSEPTSSTFTDDAAVSIHADDRAKICLLYTSPSPRDGLLSRMPSSA